MMWPVQIITDGDGYFYISDEATHRINKFDAEGEFQSMFGVRGDADGEFDGPTGISFDTEGNLVVVDSKNHRVQRYTTSGEYLGGFGSHGDGPGQFELPWGYMSMSLATSTSPTGETTDSRCSTLRAR